MPVTRTSLQAATATTSGAEESKKKKGNSSLYLELCVSPKLVPRVLRCLFTGARERSQQYTRMQQIKELPEVLNRTHQELFRRIYSEYNMLGLCLYILTHLLTPKTMRGVIQPKIKLENVALLNRLARDDEELQEDYENAKMIIHEAFITDDKSFAPDNDAAIDISEAVEKILSITNLDDLIEKCGGVATKKSAQIMPPSTPAPITLAEQTNYFESISDVAIINSAVGISPIECEPTTSTAAITNSILNQPINIDIIERMKQLFESYQKQHEQFYKEHNEQFYQTKIIPLMAQSNKGYIQSPPPTTPVPLMSIMSPSPTTSQNYNLKSPIGVCYSSNSPYNNPVQTPIAYVSKFQ